METLIVFIAVIGHTLNISSYFGEDAIRSCEQAQMSFLARTPSAITACYPAITQAIPTKD